MSDQIFRKKSLDRISSPEQLNDYIRVANPGIWMILAAVIILLAGVCVWGIFGHLDTKTETVGTAKAGTNHMLYKRNRYPECQKRNSSVHRWERI
ncbi:MAG: hypothetical protein ACLS61_13650 [Ruminococcus sp.]